MSQSSRSNTITDTTYEARHTSRLDGLIDSDPTGIGKLIAGLEFSQGQTELQKVTHRTPCRNRPSES